MAAGSNTVVLTFAGDSTRLDRTFKDVQTGAENTNVALEKSANGFKELGVQARASREILRGAGDVAMVMGTEMGGAVTNVIMLTGGVADLGRGLGHVIPMAKELAATMGVLKFASLGVAGAAGVLSASYLAQQSAQDGVWQTAKNAAAGLVDLSTAAETHLPIVGGFFTDLQNKADALAGGVSSDVGSIVNDFQRATDAAQRLMSAKANAFATGPDVVTEGGSAADFNTADNLAQYYPTPAATARAASASARSVAAGIDKVAQAAKERLSKWQGIADNYSSIAKSIADSLGPKLDAALGNTLLLSGGGGGITAALKKQLADTLHLKRDIAALAKAGLSGGLLQQLVAGGLDSLPAADELLAGGKGGISTVNGLASQITAAGGSIAGSEASRELGNQQKAVKVVVDIHGTQGDFEKLLRKMFKTQGPESFGLKAA